jgi:hypothetical protein
MVLQTETRFVYNAALFYCRGSRLITRVQDNSKNNSTQKKVKGVRNKGLRSERQTMKKRLAALCTNTRSHVFGVLRCGVAACYFTTSRIASLSNLPCDLVIGRKRWSNVLSERLLDPARVDAGRTVKVIGWMREICCVVGAILQAQD